MNRWVAQGMYKRMKEKKVSKKRQDGLFDAYLTMKARVEAEVEFKRQEEVSNDGGMEEVSGEDS